MVEDKSRDQSQKTGTPSGSAPASQRSGTSTPEVVTPTTTTAATSTVATPASVIIPVEVREYMRSSRILLREGLMVEWQKYYDDAVAGEKSGNGNGVGSMILGGQGATAGGQGWNTVGGKGAGSKSSNPWGNQNRTIPDPSRFSTSTLLFHHPIVLLLFVGVWRNTDCRRNNSQGEYIPSSFKSCP